jgi:hypothetical protein
MKVVQDVSRLVNLKGEGELPQKVRGRYSLKSYDRNPSISARELYEIVPLGSHS